MSSRFKLTTAIGIAAVAALSLSACASNAAEAEDSAAADTKAEVLVVGTSGLVRPYTFRDENDELTGYDIELLKLIDEKLDDVEFKFEITDFPALFAGLDSGRFDLVANNLSTTEERREKYDFSEPYIEAQFGIGLAANSSLDDIKTIDDLAGKRTYGTPGLNYTKILEAYNAEHPENPIIIDYTELDLQLQYQNLAAGLTDFIFSERVVYQGYGEDAGLDLTFTPLDSEYLVDTFGTNLYSAYGFTKTKDHTATIKKINAALEELIADGTVAELSNEFFGIDVTPRS